MSGGGQRAAEDGSLLTSQYGGTRTRIRSRRNGDICQFVRFFYDYFLGYPVEIVIDKNVKMALSLVTFQNT